METFSALLATQRPVTRSFDIFFDLRLNKRLSKQSWDWWFETLPRPLCRHSNVINKLPVWGSWQALCRHNGDQITVLYIYGTCTYMVNSSPLGQNGRHFADDIFNRTFLNENVWISIKISLKFVSKGAIDNKPALVQIMAWCRPGDKPLSEPMLDPIHWRI